MIPEPHISDIARVIELAVTPVFLLVAIGGVLNVLSGRLSRVVDRARLVEASMGAAGDGAPGQDGTELVVLARRARLANLAITLGTFSALLVCLLIAVAFSGAMLGVDWSLLVGLLFIAAVLALTGSLVVFLREIFVAVGALRIGSR